MFEVQVLVPVADNDGTTFTAEHHARFIDVAVGTFPGISRLPGEAIGSWCNDAGVRFDDKTLVFVVAIESLADGAKVVELARFARRHYRQEAIFIRYLGLAEVVT